MIILELFSGTGSFSKVAEARGHKVFTVDFNPIFNPNLCIDILNFDISILPEEFRHPHIIWASPPCTCFSVASLRHYWVNGKPKNEKTLNAIEIAKKTLNIIEELKPDYWVIENPRGMLRKQDFLSHLKRDTVSYCQYGFNLMKPTDLFNNIPNFKPKICWPLAPCHERASRGSKKGIQGIYNYNYEKARGGNASARAIIPPKLCEEILINCEEDFSKK